MRTRQLLASVAIALVVITSSCTIGTGKGIADNIDTVLCTGQLVIPYDSLAKPRMVFATDRSIVLTNSPSTDSLIEVYNNDGSRRYRSVPKGNGPGELPFIYGSTMDAGNGRLLIKKEKDKQHALTGIDSDNAVLGVVADYTERIDAGHKLFETLGMTSALLANGSVLVGTASPEGLLATISTDGNIRHIVSRPPLSDFGDGLPDHMIYNFMQPVMAVSPDGTHFVSIFGSADMIAFGHLEGDSVVVRTEYASAPKGIKVIAGTSFEYDDDFMFYYSSPTISREHVYVQYFGGLEEDYNKNVKAMAGGEIPAESKIRVYDIDGNLQCILIVDAIVRSMAVTPDDSTLYVLTETDEDGIHLLKYAL